MKIITRQDLANSAASKWNSRYSQDVISTYDKKPRREKTVIGQRLELLGENPKPDEVDKIIGNDAWTKSWCDECDKFVENVIIFNIDNCGSSICLDCMKKGLVELEFRIEKERLGLIDGDNDNEDNGDDDIVVNDNLYRCNNCEEVVEVDNIPNSIELDCPECAHSDWSQDVC